MNQQSLKAADSLLEFKALAPGPIKDSLILNNLNQQRIIIGAKKDEITVGLRLDIRLYDPISGREVFIDVTSISAMCASKRTKELAHTLTRLRSQLQAELDGAEDPLRRSVSAAVTDAAMAKILKYARLVAIAMAARPQAQILVPQVQSRGRFHARRIRD